MTTPTPSSNLFHQESWRKTCPFFCGWLCLIGEVWRAALLLTGSMLWGQNPLVENLETELTKSQGPMRAQILTDLTVELRGDAPLRSIAYGKEALEILANAPNAELEVKVYNEMAWAYMELGEYAMANQQANDGKTLAERTENYDGVGRALSNMGVIARRQGLIFQAVDYFEQSMTWYRKANNNRRLAMSLNNLGYTHATDLADYEQGLPYLLEALGLFKAADDQLGVALCLNNIGYIQREIGDFEKALKNYGESYAIRKKLGIQNRQASSLINIGIVHMKMNKPEEALNYYQKTGEILNQIGPTFRDGMLHMNKAKAYFALGDLPRASAFFTSGIGLSEKFNTKDTLVECLIGRATLYQQLDRFQDSETDLLRAKSIAETLPQKKLLGLHKSLAAAFERAGDYGRALENYRLYSGMSDELNQTMGALRLAFINSKFEKEKSQREIEKLEKDQALMALRLSRQRTQWILGAAGFGLALLFGFFAYRKKAMISRMAEELSLTDPLTGLKNRRFLLQTLEHDLAEVSRRHFELSPGTVAQEANDFVFYMLDLDHFKQVNDGYGHQVGDEVLVGTAMLLAETCRTSDLVVRWGGEEFLIISRFSNRHSAKGLAERLRKAIANHAFEFGEGVALKVTCSIGFAPFPFYPDAVGKVSWENVVDLADKAMYAAKKSGRNTWIGLFPNAPEACSSHEKAVDPAGQVEQGLWMVEASVDLDSVVWH